MKKIFISGFLGSGKATLLFLLDGHPDILCNVIHDKFVNCLIALEKLCINNIDNHSEKIQSNKSLKNKVIVSRRLNKKTNISIVDLREALHNTGLYHLERYSLVKKYPNFFSGDKRDDRHKWFTNFYLVRNFFEKNSINFEIKKVIKQRNKFKPLFYLENYLAKFFPNFFSWSFLITINKN